MTTPAAARCPSPIELCQSIADRLDRLAARTAPPGYQVRDDAQRARRHHEEAEQARRERES